MRESTRRAVMTVSLQIKLAHFRHFREEIIISFSSNSTRKTAATARRCEYLRAQSPYRYSPPSTTLSADRRTRRRKSRAVDGDFRYSCRLHNNNNKTIYYFLSFDFHSCRNFCKTRDNFSIRVRLVFTPPCHRFIIGGAANDKRLISYFFFNRNSPVGFLPT